MKHKLTKTTTYKILFQKAKFDKGLSIFNYATKLALLVGFGSLLGGTSIKSIVVGGFLYGLFCYATGWLWYNKRRDGSSIAEIEKEVENQFDAFVKEIRSNGKI